MKRWIGLFLLLALAAPGPARAGGDENLNDTVRRLEQRIQQLEAELKKLASGGSATQTVAAGAAATPAPLTKQESGPAEKNNTAGNNNGKNGVLWSAYLDGYYGYNFNRPANRSNQLRNFDLSSNQFNLNYAELVLERPAEPLGFRLDLGFGQAADAVHAFEPSGIGLFRHLQQAYMSYKAPVGKGLQFDFGKFVTPLGAEVIETSGNWNYSRSLLFAYAIPYYHFGLRTTYPVSPQLTVGGQIVNGWNNVTDNNTGKTYVGTVTWNPHKRVAITQNFITGPERQEENRGWRSVWDTVVLLTATDKLSLLANYDYGMDRPDGVQRAHWTGVAGGARYQVNGWFALAPRLEWFNDADGFATGLAQRVKEGTMTAEFKIRDGLLTRLEYRRDWSNQPYFHRSAEHNGRNQDTILGGLIFSFSSPR